MTGPVPIWYAVERFHVHDGQRVMLASLPGSAEVYVVDPGYALDSPLRRFGPFTEERALEIAACHASFGAVNGQFQLPTHCPDCGTYLHQGRKFSCHGCGHVWVEALEPMPEDAIDQAAAMCEHGEGETC